MSDDVALAEIIYEKVKLLPEFRQREALSFVDYLNYLSEQSQIQSLISPKYNFADIAGKLTWQGAGVVIQRELRDEW